MQTEIKLLDGKTYSIRAWTGGNGNYKACILNRVPLEVRAKEPAL